MKYPHKYIFPHPLLVRLGGYEVETLGRRSSLNLTTTATIQVVRASPSCISCLACLSFFNFIFTKTT